MNAMKERPHLVVENVSKSFGGVLALDQLSLSAERGQITGIIGSNGAGKTTLLNVISQTIRADSGRVYIGHRELTGLPAHRVVGEGVSRTFQQLRIFQKMTVLENVLLGFQNNPGEALWRVALTGSGIIRSDREMIGQAEAILTGLGLFDHAAELAQSLSYGQQKLLSLARVMATGAELIMLDEPTSGLSLELINVIQDIVKSMAAENKTVLFIEHDMEVIFEISDHIIVLDQGRLLFQGTPDEVRSNDDVRAIYLGTRIT